MPGVAAGAGGYWNPGYGPGAGGPPAWSNPANFGGAPAAGNAGHYFNSGNGNVAGAGGLISGSPGGGGGYGQNYDINGLINGQINENNQAKAANQQEWNTGSGMLTGALSDFQNSAGNQGANKIVGNIMANPDVLSQQVQQGMINKAGNQIGADSASAQRQAIGALSAGGEADAGSIAAMTNQAAQRRQMQLSDMQSNLGIQAAQINRQSELGAAQAGQNLAGQQFGAANSTANQYLQNMPQNRAMDMSGMIAGLSQFQRPAGGASTGSGQGMGGRPAWMGSGVGGGANRQYGGTTSFGAPTGDSYAFNGGAGGGGAGFAGGGYGQATPGGGMMGQGYGGQLNGYANNIGGALNM